LPVQDRLAIKRSKWLSTATPLLNRASFFTQLLREFADTPLVGQLRTVTLREADLAELCIVSNSLWQKSGFERARL
jgi:hypothetical protein